MARRPNFYEHLRAPSLPESAARFTYTFHLGAISMALVVILAVTGLLELFLYVPTPEAANASVAQIAYDVPYGWLIRNMHYWAGQALMITATMHLMRVIFTGGYKRRRSNWLIGMALMLIVLLINFTGFVLRWDERGNWALLVGTNIIRAAQPERTPDPLIAEGEAIFVSGTENTPACSMCHSLNGTTMVGPTLKDIHKTANERLPGMSAQDYLRNSIIAPDMYHAPGYEYGSMFTSYGEFLTPRQIDALVAYLMTQ